jgi:predicted membrane protein
MEKNKILGIISIILCIIGWILYSKIGIILAILIEIGALILAIYSGKKQKNMFATIGIIGAVILIVMMVVVLLGIGVYNVGDDALINKVR